MTAQRGQSDGANRRTTDGINRSGPHPCHHFKSGRPGSAVAHQFPLAAEIDGRVIDDYEAERARDTLEWADVCAQRDREKSEAVARTRAAMQASQQQ